MARAVFEKGAVVSGKQIDVPLERHAEPGLRLAFRRLAVCEIHGEIALTRQLAENRCVILDGMSGENSEAHGQPATRRSRARSNAFASALAD